MNRKHDEFVVYRPAGRKIYQYYFYRDGKRVYRSTGETGKLAAVEVARRRMDEERAGTFGAFAADFFTWGKSEWIKRQHAKNRRFSKSTAANKAHYLEKHLLPHFKDWNLADITRPAIDDFIQTLTEYSAQSKNHVLYTLKTILDYAAKDRELIPIINFDGLAFSLSANPGTGRDPVRRRGIFTLEELKKLFPKNIEKVWGNIKHGSLFYVLLITGIRSGEARALPWSAWTHGGLMIDRAAKNDGSIGSTKTGEVRFCPLNTRAEGYLSAWRHLTPCGAPDDLIFYGENGRTPYTSRALADYFGKRLDALGFDRAGRVLCVHSLRHSFNTYLRSVLPAALLKSLTGHQSDKMTAAYDHPAIEDMAARVDGARAAIEKLF